MEVYIIKIIYSKKVLKILTSNPIRKNTGNSLELLEDNIREFEKSLFT